MQDMLAPERSNSFKNNINTFFQALSRRQRGFKWTLGFAVIGLASSLTTEAFLFDPMPLAGYPEHGQVFWKLLYYVCQALPNTAYYLALGLILDTLDAVLEMINSAHSGRDNYKLLYITLVCFGALGLAEALTTEAFLLTRTPLAGYPTNPQVFWKMLYGVTQIIAINSEMLAISKILNDVLQMFLTLLHREGADHTPINLQSTGPAYGTL